MKGPAVAVTLATVALTVATSSLILAGVKVTVAVPPVPVFTVVADKVPG